MKYVRPEVEQVNPPHWARLMLVELLKWQQVAYLKLERGDDALWVMKQRAKLFPDWGEDPDNRHIMAILEGYGLVDSGDYQTAVEVIQTYYQQPHQNVVIRWTWMSAIYALAAKAVGENESLVEAKRKELFDKFADQAIECLQRALTSENSPLSKKRILKLMRDDDDYAILRDREEFQKLLEQ